MHFTISFEQMRLILLIRIEFGHRNAVKDQANNGNKNNPTIEAAQFRTTTTKKPNDENNHQQQTNSQTEEIENNSNNNQGTRQQTN